MSNALFFSSAALAAALLIGLALVTPQGLGARSPGIFGRPPAAARPAPAAPPLRPPVEAGR